MIHGIGIDLVTVARIERAMKRSERFLGRNFTEGEREYFDKKGMHPETVAGHFAAKEAVAKALGTGVRGFDLLDIEVCHDEWGAPFVRLHGGAKAVASERRIGPLFLSIAHEKDKAMAQVVAWKEEEA